MERLSNEEVLHVANLGRLELDNNEIEKYSYQLKAILDEIENIFDVEETTEEIMINPLDNDCYLTADSEGDMLDIKDVLKNAPSVYENFIEVRGAFDE